MIAGRTRGGARGTRCAAAGVAPCGLGARDTLRLEAGMNLYGQDMDETVSPLESGLALDGRPREPARFRRQGGAGRRSRRRSSSWACCCTTRAAYCARTRTCARAHGDGEITSGTFSPDARQVDRARAPARRRCAPGDRVQVDVRDKQLAARVVKPPFVRNGKVLVD